MENWGRPPSILLSPPPPQSTRSAAVREIFRQDTQATHVQGRTLPETASRGMVGSAERVQDALNALIKGLRIQKNSTAMLRSTPLSGRPCHGTDSNVVRVKLLLMINGARSSTWHLDELIHSKAAILAVRGAMGIGELPSSATEKIMWVFGDLSSFIRVRRR